jgi:hypothetical protein
MASKRYPSVVELKVKYGPRFAARLLLECTFVVGLRGNDEMFRLLVGIFELDKDGPFVTATIGPDGREQGPRLYGRFSIFVSAGQEEPELSWLNGFHWNYSREERLRR